MLTVCVAGRGAEEGVMREAEWLMGVAMLVLGGPAQAQLRLPGVPLPVTPLQSLQRGIAQADSTALEKLSDARRLAVAALIRSNPGTVAADPHGEAIVRNEILAYGPSEAGMAGAPPLGFGRPREESESGLRGKVGVVGQ